MPTKFTLPSRLAGFAASEAVEGETVQLVYRELVAPTDAEHLLDRLERMQKALFGLIPDLPPPSRIDHLLVVIQSDLSATAYVNELAIQAQVKSNRPIKAGEPLYVKDIDDISSVDLGVDIPDEAAVILVRSNGWRRSLFFDYGPILDKPIPRDFPLEKVFAQQALLLLGIGRERSGDQQIRLAEMKDGLQRLARMLEEREEDEALYQELLAEHPWMLGGLYDSVLGHENLDDQRIPDFTARRAHDLTHDIIEIKQPFLELFRRNGGFRVEFNDSWNQCERYLAFCHRQRGYLKEEKGLHFDNPRCLLLIGNDLADEQRRAIREKEILLPTMTVWTYQELVRMAEHVVALMETAGERIVIGAGVEIPDAWSGDTA